MSGGRFALLIATGRYDLPGLRRLRSPAPDAEGLAEVLRHPQVGDFVVQTVVDGSVNEVNRAVEQFFLDRSRNDLLMLHLSCHGIKNDNGELYFAARDTDPKLLASTAVSSAFLHTQMRRCRARSIILLLDCCYSGAFLRGAKGDTTVHVRDELAGHGRAVITATNRTEYAWEGDRISELEPGRSRFTEAVIDGLRTGEADLDKDGLISVHELYDYVYERILTAGVKQRPQMWAELEYKVTIARTAKKNEGPAVAALPYPPAALSASMPDVVTEPAAKRTTPLQKDHAQHTPRSGLGLDVAPRDASGVAERISSPGYTNRETCDFLKDLRTALAEHAVTYEKAAALSPTGVPPQLSRLLAGGFPSLQYTIALVSAWNGDVPSWTNRWRSAASALKKELQTTQFTPQDTLRELTRELGSEDVRDEPADNVDQALKDNSGLGVDVAPREVSGVAERISSPGYTNRETCDFLKDLRTALAEHAVT
ncbi:caspase domain-containing protein, partial [Streptomyces sp. NPDC059255]|uniref:caspase family protein n=1 Tax=Streptomyces sp. NPDC059255 TaxID=3346793 RepID=UPI0036D1BA89